MAGVAGLPMNPAGGLSTVIPDVCVLFFFGLNLMPNITFLSCLTPEK